MSGKQLARIVVAICATAGLWVATSATAMAANAPGWEVTTYSYPTNLVPGANATFGIGVYNIGAAESSPGAVVTDTLPEGVEAVSGPGENREEWSCSTGHPVICTTEVERYEVNRVASTGHVELLLPVTVGAGVPEGKVTNEVTVSGGGAANSASIAEAFTVSTKPAGFGFADAHAWASNADGTLDTQAGSHPFSFTFAFNVNADAQHRPEGEIRNMEVNLPPGLVGNATVAPRCTRAEFDQESCPPDTQIGVAPTALGGFLQTFELDFPVYNMVPPPGHPAEFAFELFNNQVFLDASVRSNGDYGITEHVTNIPQREVISSAVTIWGDPEQNPENPPFLTLPTSCKGPEDLSARANEWYNGTNVAEVKLETRDQNGAPMGLGGCERLQFGPSLTVAPDTSYADTPAGLTVEVKVPQEALVTPGGVAMANIQNTQVTLPEGVAINPGQAAGLGACGEAESGVGTLSPSGCPSDSQVGSDEIETPLLHKPLKGNVYVMSSNPPHLKLLVTASGEGVNLKLVGDVSLNEKTGQLVATFNETPELPFTDFKLSFNGGAQAALTTPVRCGDYATTSAFTAWSSPFTAIASPESEFAIDGGPGGSGCLTGTLPFSPELIAGATTDQAGGYTGFSLLLKRGDGQQRIEKLQFKAPSGLAGMLSAVPLCGEPQAAAGTCSAASQIGHSVVSSGPGPYPLVIPQPGDPESPIYLTGPYDGAPFGLSIVTHVIAGPFNLGTIVTRAKIEVDPHTAQITVTTDPLPQVIDGVPTNLRMVDAVIDRNGFMFNPTSCEPMSFSGTAWGAVPPGAGGASSTAPISSRFQVGSCRSLQLEPTFTASTQAKTTKRYGASLHVKLTYPKNAIGTQANLKYVKVELPKALPSKLETLKMACLEPVFNANPASCPAASIVGHAVVHTPVLPVPLQGPAYFVSHGGKEFPSLTIVLQGDGVTVELVGETFITKGVTSSTFNSTPDVPFESFELSLPEGKYSALAANGKLCDQKLIMPTNMIGQNGMTLEQQTRIAVEGCPGGITLLSKKIKGHTVTLRVVAPAAGTLRASGKGMGAARKSASGREPLTLVLHIKGKRAAKHSVKLVFRPAKGKRLTKTLSLTRKRG